MQPLSGSSTPPAQDHDQSEQLAQRLQIREQIRNRYHIPLTQTNRCWLGSVGSVAGGVLGAVLGGVFGTASPPVIGCVSAIGVGAVGGAGGFYAGRACDRRAERTDVRLVVEQGRLHTNGSRSRQLREEGYLQYMYVSETQTLHPQEESSSETEIEAVLTQPQSTDNTGSRSSLNSGSLPNYEDAMSCPFPNCSSIPRIRFSDSSFSAPPPTYDVALSHREHEGRFSTDINGTTEENE